MREWVVPYFRIFTFTDSREYNIQGFLCKILVFHNYYKK